MTPDRSAADLNPHEEALVRAFLTPDQRARYLRRLASPKPREKLLNRLAHCAPLDPRFARRIPFDDQTPARIYRALRARGAPARCHVMGATRLDGQEVDLREALDDVVPDSTGVFVSCIAGKLAYFGAEGPNERYILER